MTLQRILVIAPDSGLSVAPEIDALFTLGYEAQLVSTPVTSDRLFAATRNRPFDIIHFAGHADREGVIIGPKPDDRIDASGLVQLARSAHAQLIFLNGCETAEIGQVLVDEHIPAAICTLRAIGDTMAKQTAQVFYQRLRETNDIRTAYNTSKPSIKGGYSLFRNGSVTSELLTPVLEQIAQLTTLMQTSASERVTIVSANDAEHAEFRAALKDMAQCSQSFRDIKRWGVRVFLGATAFVTFFNVLFLLIQRA